MADSDDIYVRRTRALRRLAELGLEKARALQEQMLTAKTSEVADLAAEFERVAGAVRDTITAQAELERRRRRTQRLARERAARPRPLIPDPGSRTVH